MIRMPEPFKFYDKYSLFIFHLYDFLLFQRRPLRWGLFFVYIFINRPSIYVSICWSLVFFCAITCFNTNHFLHVSRKEKKMKLLKERWNRYSKIAIERLKLKRDIGNGDLCVIKMRNIQCRTWMFSQIFYNTRFIHGR